MTARWRISMARLRAVIPLVASVGGCAPQFRHLDGSPFTPVGPPISFDEGWLVVDSGAEGMHALVEMQVAAPSPDAGAVTLGLLAFQVAPHGGWTSGRSRVEGPLCWKNLPGKPGTDASVPNHQTIQVSAEAHCFYIVRAEFALDRRPVAGDLLTVTGAGRTVRFALR